MRRNKKTKRQLRGTRTKCRRTRRENKNKDPASTHIVYQGIYYICKHCRHFARREQMKINIRTKRRRSRLARAGQNEVHADRDCSHTDKMSITYSRWINSRFLAGVCVRACVRLRFFFHCILRLLSLYTALKFNDLSDFAFLISLVLIVSFVVLTAEHRTFFTLFLSANAKCLPSQANHKQNNKNHLAYSQNRIFSCRMPPESRTATDTHRSRYQTQTCTWTRWLYNEIRFYAVATLLGLSNRGRNRQKKTRQLTHHIHTRRTILPIANQITKSRRTRNIMAVQSTRQINAKTIENDSKRDCCEWYNVPLTQLAYNKLSQRTIHGERRQGAQKHDGAHTPSETAQSKRHPIGWMFRHELSTPWQPEHHTAEYVRSTAVVRWPSVFTHAMCRYARDTNIGSHTVCHGVAFGLDAGRHGTAPPSAFECMRLEPPWAAVRHRVACTGPETCAFVYASDTCGMVAGCGALGSCRTHNSQCKHWRTMRPVDNVALPLLVLAWRLFRWPGGWCEPIFQ